MKSLLATLLLLTPISQANADESSSLGALLADKMAQLHCTNVDRKRLLLEQQFWIRELNNCRNVDSSKSCVANTRAKHASYLRALTSCQPSSPYKYAFTDPWYIQQHGDLYLNDPVNVFGSLRPNSCSLGSKSLYGVISGVKKSDGYLSVFFKSLPAEERAFLCDQQPSAHWIGQVKSGAHGVILYVDSILGVPLP